MDFYGPDFVIAIIAMSFGAWIITSWIRAKHGYPLENEWGGTDGTEAGPGGGPQDRPADIRE